MRLVPHKLPLFALLVAAGLFSACDSPVGTTPPPTTTGPTLVCPLDVTVTSQSGAPMPVNYPLPASTTTHPPVTVKCTPASDSEFPVGSNLVVCTAVDSVGQATCSFRVAVALPERRLKFTKFMAFGDSTTEGFLREPANFATGFSPHFLDPEVSYPSMLQEMLRQRYGSSEIVVINRGLGGETIAEGMDRIVTEIEVHQPQVVLLLEGYNGLRETTTSQARAGLRAMGRWSQTHGADVVLATLFQVSDDREDSRPGSQAAIDDLNDAIRGLASSLGLGGVADLEKAFGTGVGLLGSDGLHPNPAGYQRMAETFRDEIVRRFEEVPAATPPPTTTPAGNRARVTSARRQFVRTSGH